MPEWAGRARPSVIAVDFDGVCCRDHGIWQGVGKFGHPIDSTRRLLRTLKERGWVVIIWTTRAETDLIRKYLQEHGFPFDYVNENPYRHDWGSDKVKADIYLDDRAVHFVDDYDAVLNAITEVTRYRRGLQKWVTLEMARQYVTEVRREGGTIVFTNGCFDILHEGHIRLLSAAREQGDYLVVGLNSDASVRRLKGPGRPIISQDSRATVLAGLECVDLLVAFEEDTPHKLLEALRPDVLVKGGDYTHDAVVGADFVESYGGRVCIVPLWGNVSTTVIADSIRRSAGADSSG